MSDPVDFNYHRAMGLTLAASKAGQAVFAYDVAIVDSGSSDPTFNIGFPLRGGYKLAQALDRIEAHFANRKLPFRVQVSRAQESEVEATLLDRGYGRQSERTPGMVLRNIEAFQVQEWTVPGLVFERVTGAALMDIFADAAFASYGLPVEHARAVLCPRLLEDPAVTAFVGFQDGRPACTSLVYATGEVGGIYWVGTVPSERGRGLGAAVTARAVQEARERGCSLASLQASKMGQRVYARMGFALDREYTDYRPTHRASAG